MFFNLLILKYQLSTLVMLKERKTQLHTRVIIFILPQFSSFTTKEYLQHLLKNFQIWFHIILLKGGSKLRQPVIFMLLKVH